MQDLYRGFKKVNEDEQRAVLKHENGHELVIAKSGISKKQKRALDKLPIYQAEGTPIEEEQPQVPEPELDSGDALKQIGAQITEAVAQKVIEGAEESIPPQREPASVTPEEMAALEQYKQEQQAPAEPRPEGTPAPGLSAHGTPEQEMAARLPSEPSGFGAAIMEPQAALERQVATPQEGGPGILGVTTPSVAGPAPMQEELPMQRPVRAPRVAVPLTPEETLASPTTSASQKMMAYNQMIMNTVAERRKMRDDYIQAMKDKKIERKKIYGENTGKNILTALSLLLGGAAGGILRQENPVLKMLNEEIERDLNEQKANINQEATLYKENLALFGDEISAYTQSMNQMRQIALTQLEEMMGKSYNPTNPMMMMQVRAEAARLQDQINKTDEAIASREQRKKILNALENTGGVSDMDPTSLVPIMVTDDQDRRKVLEEIADREMIAKTLPQIDKLFDQAVIENTALRTGKLPYIGTLFKRPDSVESLETLLRPLIKTQGPAREAEMQAIFKSVVPAPYDSDDDAKLKKQTLNQFLNAASSAPTARSHGLDLNKFSRTNYVSSEQQKINRFIEYAKQNINSSDPAARSRAQKVLQLYGR